MVLVLSAAIITAMRRPAKAVLTTLGLPEITASSAAKNSRIRLLEELSGLPLTDAGEAVDVLCDMVTKIGAIEPEIGLITKCLRRATRSRGPGQDRLLSLVADRSEGAVQCACRTLRGLDADGQARLGVLLVRELAQRDTADHVTGAIATTLKGVSHSKVRRAVAAEAASHLHTPDGFVIKHTVAILSRVGDKSVESALLTVLSKLLGGYFRSYEDVIAQDLCFYFARFKTAAAIPELLKGLEKTKHRVFAETVGMLCDSHPEAQHSLLRLVRQTQDASVKVEYFRALATMRKTRPRISEISDLVGTHDLRFTTLREFFRQILLRDIRSSRRVLLAMLHDDDEQRTEFAIGLLQEIGATTADIAKALGGNPVRLVYNFFWGQREGQSLESLWEEKAKLGDNIKGKITKLDHLLITLMTSLGFLTIDVDPSGRAGVDVVAFSPTSPHVLLIGATTGVIGDNVEKISNTVRDLRVALGKVATRIEIIPIIATSLSGETNPRDEDHARRNGIVILRQLDIDRLMEWVATNRDYRSLLAYLKDVGRRSNTH
jgi:hypothetical protein